MTTDFRRIPSSQAAAAAGIVEWGTPLSVYLAASQGHAWSENPEEPQRGVRLKPALRAWSSQLLSRAFLPCRSEQVTGGKFAFLSARPDGVTGNGSTALLLRTPVNLERWFEQLPDDASEDELEKRSIVLPPDVKVECAALAMVMRGLSEVTVGVLIGGQLKFVSYFPDASFEGKVFTLLSALWRGNVEGGRPPRAQKGDEKVLCKLFPKATREKPVDFMSLPDVYKDAVIEFTKAQRQRTAAQKIEKENRPKVVQALADFPGMTGFPVETGITSISFEERAPHANNGTWKAISTELLEKLTPQSKAKLLKKHTPEVGTRVLRPYFAKDEAAVAA